MPAVDRQFDTGDVVGAVRAQKHHRACNFFRRAQASSLDSSGPEKPMPAAATSMSMRPACAPRAASASAEAAPMPLAAPVTSATCPENSLEVVAGAVTLKVSLRLQSARP